MAKRLIFSVNSPLGYRVVLDRNRWKLIIRYKHPALAEEQELVRSCIVEPESVRQSENDADVHAYYKRSDGHFVCVVVAPASVASDRFVVTAYFTKKIKKGALLWTK